MDLWERACEFRRAPDVSMGSAKRAAVSEKKHAQSMRWAHDSSGARQASSRLGATHSTAVGGVIQQTTEGKQHGTIAARLRRRYPAALTDA